MQISVLLLPLLSNWKRNWISSEMFGWNYYRFDSVMEFITFLCCFRIKMELQIWSISNDTENNKRRLKVSVEDFFLILHKLREVECEIRRLFDIRTFFFFWHAECIWFSNDLAHFYLKKKCFYFSKMPLRFIVDINLLFKNNDLLLGRDLLIWGSNWALKK